MSCQLHAAAVWLLNQMLVLSRQLTAMAGRWGNPAHTAISQYCGLMLCNSFTVDIYHEFLPLLQTSKYA
jgi:hypothetical protein